MVHLVCISYGQEKLLAEPQRVNSVQSQAVCFQWINSEITLADFSENCSRDFQYLILGQNIAREICPTEKLFGGKKKVNKVVVQSYLHSCVEKGEYNAVAV